MSKILKRPMFRIGGSANDGIMSMAAPRKNYQEGTANPEVIKKYLENKAALRQALGPGPSVRGDLGDLLISGGLNLLSGKGAGRGTLGALAESYKEPYAAFEQARDQEESLGRQIDLSAATGALSSIEAAEAARKKAESDFRIANIQARKDVPTFDEEIEALTFTYLPEYGGDFNKSRNRALFEKQKRPSIANIYGQTQVGGLIEFDIDDPKAVDNFIKKNSKKINKIYYDLNTGQTIKFIKNSEGQYGFIEVDLDKPIDEENTISEEKSGEIPTEDVDLKSQPSQLKFREDPRFYKEKILPEGKLGLSGKIFPKNKEAQRYNAYLRGLETGKIKD